MVYEAVKALENLVTFSRIRKICAWTMRIAHTPNATSSNVVYINEIII